MQPSLRVLCSVANQPILIVPQNMEAAQEALSDMPPRGEDELDPVTLHNQGLMNMDEDPTGGFRKLNFLLQTPPFPAETFGNLLLLYVKHQYYDLAADVLAENTHLTYQYLSPELFEFLDACIMTQSAPEVSSPRHIHGCDACLTSAAPHVPRAGSVQEVRHPHKQAH